MPKFMIEYHGGNKPASEEEAMEQMNKWKEWVNSLGNRITNSGTPLRNSKILTSEGVNEDNDPNSMKGYAVIMAENVDTAVGIAQTDPFLQYGGTIRISEMIEK